MKKSIIAFALFALACSKDRTMLLDKLPPVPEKAEDKFTTIERNTLARLASQPVRKTIKNDNDLPFTGAKGTKVWLYTRDLKMPDGSAVSYPFDIELLELFNPKDMILHQMPTVSEGRLLTTAGEINIKAYKDGKELKLNRFNSTQIIVPANGPIDAFMELFYGQDSNGEFIDWNLEKNNQGGPSSIGNIYSINGAYSLFPEQLGWINIDKFYDFTEAKTAITFSSEDPPIKNILVFLYFPDLKSLMQVYRGISGDVPVERTVKVIAIGITKDEQYYSFFQEMVVKDKQKVEIKLAPTTKESLLKYLDSL